MIKQALVTSWKTTISGIITGFPLILTGIFQAIASKQFVGESKTEIIAGVGLILMGVLAKDHDVSGNPPTSIP